MLLSKKLDPAIGLISKQPHDALLEIAEWIQYTWEYSNPMKFEVIKEVIARGVSLRRAELWKKIRNSDPKPEDVSDRTWRSLRRELENPTTIRRAQNCSKANASRVNFGRTGPSGEVGVRERLKKRLRRSPEPEEIRFEMARDKGYGGQHQKNRARQNIMHGSEAASPLPAEVAPISGELDNREEDTNDEDCTHPGTSGSPIQIHDNIGSSARAATVITGGGRVGDISAEELATNPFVMKLMDRIAALEGRRSSTPIQVPSLDIEDLPAARADGPVGDTELNPQTKPETVSTSCLV